MVYSYFYLGLSKFLGYFYITGGPWNIWHYSDAVKKRASFWSTRRAICNEQNTSLWVDAADAIVVQDYDAGERTLDEGGAWQGADVIAPQLRVARRAR